MVSLLRELREGLKFGGRSTFLGFRVRVSDLGFRVYIGWFGAVEVGDGMGAVAEQFGAGKCQDLKLLRDVARILLSSCRKQEVPWSRKDELHLGG